MEVNSRTDWSPPLFLPDQILPPQKRQDDTLAAQNLATQEKIASMQVEKIEVYFHFLRRKVEVIQYFQEELDMSRLQVKQLNDLVSEADEIVKVFTTAFNFSSKFCEKS